MKNFSQHFGSNNLLYLSKKRQVIKLTYEGTETTGRVLNFPFPWDSRGRSSVDIMQTANTSNFSAGNLPQAEREKSPCRSV